MHCDGVGLLARACCCTAPDGRRFPQGGGADAPQVGRFGTIDEDSTGYHVERHYEQ